MKVDWTMADQAAAMQEHWAIFIVDDDNGQHHEIQRLDAAARIHFSGDSDAQAFVRKRAALGSPLHVKALRYIGIEPVGYAIENDIPWRQLRSISQRLNDPHSLSFDDRRDLANLLDLVMSNATPMWPE